MKHLSSLLIVLVLLLCSTDKINTSGTVDDTETVIAIRGRVLTKAGDGVPLVITKLVKTGFADTTDADGNYAILVTKTTLQSSGILLDSIKTDTVQYSKDNSIFTWETVTTWKITLPDVYLVQRNISGKLSVLIPSIQRLEAIIFNLSDTTKKPVKVPLWHNVVNNTYSGFAYFVTTVEMQKYAAYVDVYADDTIRLTGRSLKILFNSIAGDIDIPEFGPNNARPVVFAGKDTIVSINDTIRLHATAVDSFGGTIVKWEWDIGNTGVFTASGDSMFSFQAQSLPINAYPCAVRVTDDDGNVALDTVNISVVQDIPIVVITGGSEQTVPAGDTIVLTAKVSDGFGRIVKWEWDCGNTGTFVNTTPACSVMTVVPNFMNDYICAVRATDDDGNVATDRVVMKIGWKKVLEDISLGETYFNVYSNNSDSSLLWVGGTNEKTFKRVYHNTIENVEKPIFSTSDLNGDTIKYKFTRVMTNGEVVSLWWTGKKVFVFTMEGAFWKLRCPTIIAPAGKVFGDVDIDIGIDGDEFVATKFCEIGSESGAICLGRLSGNSFAFDSMGSCNKRIYIWTINNKNWILRAESYSNLYSYQNFKCINNSIQIRYEDSEIIIANNRFYLLNRFNYFLQYIQSDFTLSNPINYMLNNAPTYIVGSKSQKLYCIAYIQGEQTNIYDVSLVDESKKMYPYIQQNKDVPYNYYILNNCIYACEFAQQNKRSLYKIPVDWK